MNEDDLPPDVGAEDVDASAIEQTEAPQPVSVDDLATEMGWTPQDKWRGAPEKWRPADEFLRKTVDVNRNLTSRLKGVEEQVTHMARTSATLTEQAVAKAREEALREREEAFETGDKAAFQAAERKLDAIPQVAPPAPKEVEDFKARNPWFETDPEARAWAINRGEDLKAFSTTRQLAIIEREAKGLFPELFPEATPRPAAAPLNRPGARASAPAPKGYSSLPADVQAAADSYVKRGVCTREEYARIYYEQGAGA